MERSIRYVMKPAAIEPIFCGDFLKMRQGLDHRTSRRGEYCERSFQVDEKCSRSRF